MVPRDLLFISIWPALLARFCWSVMNLQSCYTDTYALMWHKTPEYRDSGDRIIILRSTILVCFCFMLILKMRKSRERKSYLSILLEIPSQIHLKHAFFIRMCCIFVLQTPHQQTDKLDLAKNPDMISAGGGFGPVNIFCHFPLTPGLRGYASQNWVSHLCNGLICICLPVP